MAWVAFDRAIKSAEAFHLTGPIDRWRDLRAEIHTEVCERAFNRGIGAFVRHSDQTGSTPAPCLSPRSASCRQRMRACGEQSRQSSGGSCPMGSCCGTIP